MHHLSSQVQRYRRQLIHNGLVDEDEAPLVREDSLGVLMAPVEQPPPFSHADSFFTPEEAATAGTSTPVSDEPQEESHWPAIVQNLQGNIEQLNKALRAKEATTAQLAYELDAIKAKSSREGGAMERRAVQAKLKETQRAADSFRKTIARLEREKANLNLQRERSMKKAENLKANLSVSSWVLLHKDCS